MAGHRASRNNGTVNNNSTSAGNKHNNASTGNSSGPGNLHDNGSSSSRERKRSREERRRSRYSSIRRNRTGCCRDKEVRKGVGAVLFALGIPTAVAGLVMTVVAATDDDHNGKYPPAFSAVGPILLVCAFFFFLAGFSLLSPIMANLAERCFSFDDPSSYCRVHCPRLSNFLKPDESALINRAAMNALKTEPGKSVLKRQPRPSNLDDDPFSKLPISRSVSADESGAEGGAGQTLPQQRSLDSGMPAEASNGRRAGFKGVRFSESDAEDGRLRGRAVSVSSETSQASLRHCKIYPKEYPKEEASIWYTKEHTEELWKDRTQDFMTTEL